MRFSLVLCAGILCQQLFAGAVSVAPARIAGGFSRPVAVCAPPGDTQRLFVLEQQLTGGNGRIRIINLSNNTVMSTPFLTISGITTGNEQGLLGMTFHPNYATNGYLYLNFTTTGGGSGGHTEVARFRCQGDPATSNIADASSRTLILQFDQPESNHNGGWLGFGHDGYLYIGSGDGGGANDIHGSIGNGQNLNTLLGKLLRIDVDSASPYAIPDGNPYKGDTSKRQEIWAFGLRNPFRCSVDRQTGDIWIGDVGQGAREEIDFIPNGTAGRNFGWRPREGTIQTPVHSSETPITAATNPVVDYVRQLGICVIGGYVYRGSAIPGLQGTYFYADYSSARFWSLNYDGTTVTNHTERTTELNSGSPRPIGNVTSFGEDAAGELYICDMNDGEIYKIVSSLSITTNSLPATTVGAPYSQTLAATGGLAPYTWTRSAGAFPTGVTVSAIGVISGTPSAAGTANFTIRVADVSGASTTKAFSIVVNSAPSITTASPLNPANIGIPYSENLAATGGTGSLTWSAEAATLPAGVTLSPGGVLSGTPTEAGNFDINVSVTDSLNVSGSKTLMLTAQSTLAITTPPTIPQWTESRAYSQTLAADGGTPDYLWGLIDGELPDGVSLSTTGVLSGTPTANGSFNFTTQVSDSLLLTATQSFTWLINAAPQILDASIPSGHAGAAYSFTLTATGGTSPLTWSCTGLQGSGITFTEGVFSGTPPAAGTFNLNVTLLDAAGATSSVQFTLSVTNSPAITSTPVGSGNIGVPYSYQITATGVPAPAFAFSANPPAGMTIDPASGLISWLPGAAGDFYVSIVASNGLPPDATQSFQIRVTDYGLATRLPVSPYLNMPQTVAGNLPAKLSNVGAFASVENMDASTNLIPFTVNSPLWSDGAHKQRWIALPNDGAPYGASETVTFSQKNEWQFPAGTVFVKHFELSIDERTPSLRKRIETRVLVADGTGGGYGVTYKWNATGTDADLLPDGLSEQITITTADGGSRQQLWYYPSRNDCMTCHNANAKFVLGANTRQLNGTLTYPSTGVADNQIRTWNHIRMFSGVLNEDSIPNFSKLVSVDDSLATLEHRSLSYIDANCAQCHRPGGAPSNFDARFELGLQSQNLLNGAVSDTLGINGARVIAPGNRARSITLHRMDLLGQYQMPQLARNVIDNAAVNTLSAWIASMAAVPTGLSAVSDSETRINLSWTDNGDSETGFRVERSLNGTDFTEIASLPPDSTSASDTGLSESTQYFYRVRSLAANDSAASEIVSASTYTSGGVIPAAALILSNPKPAYANSPVTFTLDVPNAQALTWSWDFGDGQTSSAAVATHTFTTPGLYNVSVLVRNPAGQTGTRQALTVVIGRPLIDSDGDSFADVEEASAGTDPFDAQSHPDAALQISKFAASVKFGMQNKDACSIAGTLPATTANAVTLDIGGLVRSFDLIKGRGKSANGSFALKLNRKTNFSAFSSSLRGSFASEWADEGVVAGQSGQLNFPIMITIDGRLYADVIPVKYVSNSKTGTLKGLLK